MKIISWNVNGIRACYKKNLIEFVQQEKPNIFCIQETKGHREQVEERARTLDMNCSHWSSAVRKGYSGVATFLDREPNLVSLGIGKPEYDSEGRFVITDHGDFLVYNIYFPNGGSGEIRHNFKQLFLKDLYQHLQEQLKKGRSIVVLGDYNIAHREIDIHDPVRLSKESGFLPEEREWFSSFLNLGFIDTFRHCHPDERNKYSWWSYREFARIANRGWRIDYICVSKSLEKRILSAHINDDVMGSDHCPVSLELST